MPQNEIKGAVFLVAAYRAAIQEAAAIAANFGLDEAYSRHMSMAEDLEKFVFSQGHLGYQLFKRDFAPIHEFYFPKKAYGYHTTRMLQSFE